MALQAKAKAEAGYRFYALYDKISREDILTHAFAQCRSNKGAPGTDGQDFADIETYGVERWLGELALALRQETYRPDPIRRVYIPKANGKLRPLGIPTLRDRVCMTAAMLVLEPIFEADLPSEQYVWCCAATHGLTCAAGKLLDGFVLTFEIKLDLDVGIAQKDLPTGAMKGCRKRPRCSHHQSECHCRCGWSHGLADQIKSPALTGLFVGDRIAVQVRIRPADSR